MTVYGCGLRISEATQLKTSGIDRARMQLRVRNGKGVKGRVLPLSDAHGPPEQRSVAKTTRRSALQPGDPRIDGH